MQRKNEISAQIKVKLFNLDIISIVKLFLQNIEDTLVSYDDHSVTVSCDSLSSLYV